MSVEERQALYELIHDIFPQYVIEVGTCRGGGSTYIASAALYNNKSGHLYTIEQNHEFYQYARELYDSDLKNLSGVITFNFGNALQIYKKMLKKLEMFPEFPIIVILDGSEDPVECLYEFTMFRDYLRVGDYVLFHDWKASTKTDLVRRVMPMDKDFELVKVVDILAIFKRVGDYYA